MDPTLLVTDKPLLVTERPLEALVAPLPVTERTRDGQTDGVSESGVRMMVKSPLSLAP